MINPASTTARRLAVVALLVGGAVALGWARPMPAAAHTELIATEPADGSTTTESPAEIVLRFNEPVEVPNGGIRVFDADGNRVDEGAAPVAGEDGDEARLALPPNLGHGSYVVSWRAVSADGHPVTGAFVFGIGEAAVELDEGVIGGLLGGASDRVATVLGAALRWLAYAAGLVVIGATALLFALDPDTPARARVERLVRRSAVTGIAVSLLAVPVQGAEVTGLGLSVLTSGEALGAAATGSVGRAAGLRIAGFALVLIALGTRRAPVLAGPAVALVVTAELLTGHTLTTEPIWLVMAADAAHVAAAGIWVGGLAALAVALPALRSEDDPLGAARAVGGFSSSAGVAVAVLAVAGLTMAFLQVRTLEALVSTAYGRTLLVKVLAAAAVVSIGAYNRRTLVPAVTAALEEPSEPSVDGAGSVAVVPPRLAAWQRLGKTVRWELVGLAAVLALTAVLVNLQPAAEAAGVTAPFSTYADLGDGNQVNLVVDPNRAGDNQVHAYLIDSSGRPADLSDQVIFRFSLPAEQIGPIEREAIHAGTGHFLHAGPELALAGSWEIEVVVPSGFQELATTVPVTVNP